MGYVSYKNGWIEWKRLVLLLEMSCISPYLFREWAACSTKITWNLSFETFRSTYPKNPAFIVIDPYKILGDFVPFSDTPTCPNHKAVPRLHPWVPIPIALVPAFIHRSCVKKSQLSGSTIMGVLRKKNSQQDVIWYDLECSPNNKPSHLTGAKRRVAEWVAGGCWDYEIDSSPVDHSL